MDIAICMNICLIINSILSAWEQPGQGDDGNRVHGKDHSGTHSGRLDGDAHAHKDEQGVTQLWQTAVLVCWANRTVPFFMRTKSSRFGFSPV